MYTHRTIRRISLVITIMYLLALAAGAQTYCTPVYLVAGGSCNASVSKILSVNIAGINGSQLSDNPPCSPDYKDRTIITNPVTLARGRTYYGSLGASYSGTCYNIWIDLDDDGVFSNPERIVVGGHPNYTYIEYVGSPILYNAIQAFELPIPANAPTGMHRMRIRTAQASSATAPILIDPCANTNGTVSHAYGAATDYMVNIVPADTCAPIFTTNASQQTICAGGSLSYTVGTDVPASLQWQVNAGAGFTDIANNSTYGGATTGTLSITGITDQMSGYQYRCVATNGSCSSVSKTVVLSTGKVPITTQPITSRTTVLDGNTSFFVSAASVPGITYSYQWQVNDGNGFVNIVNSTHYTAFSGSLIIRNATNGMNGYQYRCVISNGTCSTASNVGTLTVIDKPLPEFKYGQGTGSAMEPMGSNGAGYTKQSIYTPGDFGTVQAGLIKKIYMRTATSNIVTGYKNFTVKAGLSTLTSIDTFQSGLTTVRYDSVFQLPAVLNYEWVQVELQTPIFYDPSKSLIVEISQNGRTNFMSGGMQLFTDTLHANTSYTGFNGYYLIHGSNFKTKTKNLTNIGFDIDPCLAVSSRPGDITVNADAGSCSATNVSLGAPVANSSCGTVSIGNNAPTVFPKGATVVTWTVSDGYIADTFTQTVTVISTPPVASISVTPANNVYTGGMPTNIYLGYGPQSATLTANVTGSTGFTYSWSPATDLSCTNCQGPVFAPSAAGNYSYTVTATNNTGCSATATIGLCVLDIRSSSNKVYLCHNGNTLSVNPNAVPAHLSNHSGDHLGSCSQSCGTANKTNPDEENHSIPVLKDEQANDAVKVYPNPSAGSFVVEIPGDMQQAEVCIIDMTGKVIIQKNGSGMIPFSSTGIAKGVYTIQIRSGSDLSRTKLTIY